MVLDKQDKNTREERIAWIAVLLLTREVPIYQKDLMKKFSLSKSTVQKDLKLLAVSVINFRLHLQYQRKNGYYISGDEQDKRKVLVYFLSKIYHHKQTHYHQKWRRDLVASSHVHKIYQILLESEKYTNLHYPLYVLELLSIQLLLLLNRYKQGKVVHLDPIEKVMVKPSAEFIASGYIGEKIKSIFGIDVPDDELCYITVCLMAAKSPLPTINATDEDMEILKSVIKEMVDQFQREAKVEFKDRSSLERSLFFHIKSAYYRIVLEIEYTNPLAETIITTYSDLFLLTKKVISHLEDVIGKKISNDEIALITMHFGGWIEKDPLI